MKKRNKFFLFMGMYLLSTFMPTKAENPTFYRQDNPLQTIEYVQEPINPTLSENNGLKTKSIALDSLDATKMIAKFTSTKSIGDTLNLMLSVRGKDTIRMDWGNGVITEHPLSGSSLIFNISGTKQGDTIRIYADSATGGEFSSNGITYLDIRLWDKIERLICPYNYLSTLDLSKNTSLNLLNLIYNKLSTLDLSKNTKLMYLDLSRNQLSTLNISNNTLLSQSFLAGNQLSTLNISKNTLLETLALASNQLSTLDLSKNTKLTYLDLDFNQLSTLNISNNTLLGHLYLTKNKLNIRTLPILRKGMRYFYFPQKPEGILLPQTINIADTLDLSYYASTLDDAGIEQKSKFTWYIENADSTLQALTNKDYQATENAKFIFNRSGNLKCYVQNAAFPASTVPSNQGFTGFESTLVHVSPSIPDTIRFVVRITPAQNGSFTVKNGSKTIQNGDLVDSNTHLQLVAIPEKGYIFDQWWDKDTLATKEYILKSSVSISALFKKGLAVEEEQGKLNIRTYTNNQIIYIELPGEESYLVEIYDLQGRRIHFQKNAMHTINFPVNSKGTYILRVRNATEKWVQKIIVS